MSNPNLLIVGLGPAGLDRLPATTLGLLEDAGRQVIVRTLHHPACRQLAKVRTIASCDDLYEAADSFDEVYAEITARVLAEAERGPVAYCVPGSAVVGERSVSAIRAEVEAGGGELAVLPGESFLDLAYAAAGLDPIADAVKVVDGRALPDPLIFDVPIVVTQVDRAEVAADVAAQLGRVLDDAAPILVLDRLGDEDEVVRSLPLAELTEFPFGPRTTLYLNPGPHGWYGLVATNRILRKECPWDRKQTHHSLLSHLIEEAYETVTTIRSLAPDAPRGDPDFGIYAEVEEELGDLLLQVVFHATLAREAGAFDVEEVAEVTRRKLVNRHPHVFGDVVAEDPATVITNWESIKSEEKARDSLMDDIPAAMPAITRADKMQRRARSAGFDWPDAAPVFAKINEELDELLAAAADPELAAAELGDVLFAVVNLARHLAVDPELALAGASDRFEARIRHMEQEAQSVGNSLADYSLEELDALWERAKSTMP